MDHDHIIACLFILGFPALAVMGAALFLQDIVDNPYNSER
jgi:hypothetical protein